MASSTIDRMPSAHATVYSRREGVSSNAIKDGAILVDVQSGACFELNRVGAEVWEQLASGATEGAICDALAQRHTVERAMLASDVRALLESLVAHRLIDARELPTNR
jgi:hypothetical protein